MILEKLEIEFQRWGAEKGRHTGTVVFSGDGGKVSLNLTPALCEKMFLICAEGIEATAKEAARNLTCSVIEHRKILEAT